MKFSLYSKNHTKPKGSDTACDNTGIYVLLLLLHREIKQIQQIQFTRVVEDRLLDISTSGQSCFMRATKPQWQVS